MRPARVLLALALALASAGGGFLAFNALRDAPSVADDALPMLPEFALPDVEGVIRQSSEWDGRPRVVNFWATWCPPCRREIPLLIALQAGHSASLQVIGIAIDDMAAVQEYAADTGFNYPVLVGQQNAVELGNQVLPDWIGLPFTAFVDASGHVTAVHMGELHPEDVKEFIREVL